MPLTYRDRGTSGTQLDVMSGTEVIAGPRKQPLSLMGDPFHQWRWTFNTGPTERPATHGSAATIEAAKAAIERDWQSWLKAAGLHE